MFFKKKMLIMGMLSGVTACKIQDDDTGRFGDTALPFIGLSATQKTTSGNGFTYPLASLASWGNGNYGACGSSYFSGYCHIGNDMSVARGTTVYSLAAGTVLSRSGTQNAVCSSGWGYDYSSGSGTRTCNMALAVQYYDDDGTPFVVVVGHLQYSTTYGAGSTVTPGTALGQVADWYYCASYSSTASCSGSWVNGGDHLHFGVFPGTTIPSAWGRMPCATSQAAGTSLPGSCSSGGATAPGSYMSAAGRNWVVPPSAPTLSSPSNASSVSSPVSLQWINGSGTYRSHLMVCTNASLTSGCFNPDGGMTGAETTSTGAARSTSYSATLSAGTYYWAVRGIAYTDYGGWGGYSSVRSFTVR